jgi:hypothetical protein
MLLKNHITAGVICGTRLGTPQLNSADINYKVIQTSLLTC